MDKTNLRFDWIGKTTIQKQWHDLTRDELLMYVDWLENRLLKNCSIPNVVGQSEELVCDHQWYIRFSEKRGSWRLCAKCSKEG